MAKIAETLNGFRAFSTLYRLCYDDPRVAEVEGAGCEEGRIFIHLAPGYWFGPHERVRSMTVGSRKELLYVMSLVEPEPTS